MKHSEGLRIEVFFINTDICIFKLTNSHNKRYLIRDMKTRIEKPISKKEVDKLVYSWVK